MFAHIFGCRKLGADAVQARETNPFRVGPAFGRVVKWGKIAPLYGSRDFWHNDRSEH